MAAIGDKRWWRTTLLVAGSLATELLHPLVERFAFFSCTPLLAVQGGGKKRFDGSGRAT